MTWLRRIHFGPGGALVDAAASMMSSMGAGFPAFSEAFSSRSWVRVA